LFYVCGKGKALGRLVYSHKLDVSSPLKRCWNGARAVFKSFFETQDVRLLFWFDPRRFFTSFKSSLMMFTASSNVEDSHDALSSTVDCASTSVDDSIISTPITIAKQNTSDILSHCTPEAGTTALFTCS